MSHGTSPLVLRAERKRRGWSLTRLSGLTLISASDLSQIERGQRHVYPGWRHRIAEAFGLPESHLFSELIVDEEKVAC
ncbi:MAG: helix-turn-helix domain-containing protein [Vicinamibacterales bacterium]